jgi:peptidoglycan/xylan/chitin deacetylase (PgdA/CDA1 family)
MYLIRSFVTGLALLGGISSWSWASPCKNPEAIGVARTLEVDPRAYPLVGKVQYLETLPLSDREVVLSFDDGPVENVTEAVLQDLKRECVKATFFMIGIHAAESPELVRRVYDEGHTVGFHTFTHPDVEKMTFEKAKADIRKGIAAVTEALGPTRKPAPFYRPPYLSMTHQLQRYLNERGMMIWSIDADSLDWVPATEDVLLKRTIDGLEKAGKGILLMHDMQPQTAHILPRLLRELKLRNFKIVHVVPLQGGAPMAAQQLRSTATPGGWREFSNEIISLLSTYLSNTWAMLTRKA